MMSTVKVAVRVRPVNKREREMNSSMIIHMEANTTQISNVKLPSTGTETFGRERLKQFTYDYSYWSVADGSPKYASQEKVFDDLGFDVVQSSYQGYNACVFAYGQTGSGKTYTMMGSPDDPGLTPRICESLFSCMCVGDTTYRTEVSYLEIYNERVRDLLRDHNQPQLNLKVREHPKEGPYVQDLTRHLVKSYTDIEELLNKGNMNRTTAATNMNDHSSRSHAIFTILFTQAKFTEDVPSEVHSKIHLVDLAGSERADMAGTTGERLKEGGSINKSLVTLGNVISSLADLSEKSNGLASRRSVFIPYRDSVLTWLLKDSLGGNAKTIMIATISPAECNYAETLSTLRYAKRAKRIVNKPTINEDPNVLLIRELRAENARLRALLAENMKQGNLTPTKDFANETREKLTRNEEKVQELLESWTVKWQQLADILQEHEMLALRKEGSGVVLDSELPYLLCIDDDILSTGMKLYHLKEGDTSVGREDAAVVPDIILVGRCIEADHCTIHYEGGEVTLVPLDGAMCFIDNIRISEPMKLSQGSVIRLGRSHLFRFNHPGEVARMKEELKENGKSSSVRLWKDIQWMSSTVSMTDSAVGSDLGELLEYDMLEEKRKEVERLEEEHSQAEARRLTLFASQEVDREELKMKEEELHWLSSNAQVKIESLNASIQHQYYINQVEKGRLLEEQRRLQDLQSKFEQDKALDRAERQKLQDKIDLEQTRLDECNHRLAEWAEITTEYHQLQASLHENEKLDLIHQKDQTVKFQNLERNIWKEEISEMRHMVDAEIQNLRILARLSTGDADDRGNDASADVTDIKDDDNDSLILDSLILDIDSLKLVVPSDEENPITPELFLLQPSEVAGDASTAQTRPLTEKEVPGDESSLIGHLVTKSYDLHEEICVAFQLKYSSFCTARRRVELKVEFEAQFNSLCQSIEEVSVSSEISSGDYTLTKESLEECKRITTVIVKLLRIDTTILHMEKLLSEHEYLDVLDGLESIHSLMSSMETEEEVEVKVQRVIQTELCIIRERLLYEIGEGWSRLVKWVLPSEKRRLARKPRSVMLEFYCDDEANNRLFSVVVAALIRSHILDLRMKLLSDNLMSYIVENVIRDCTTVLQVDDEPGRRVICVVINPAATGQQRQVVTPDEAFVKLERIFTCLHSALSGVTVALLEGRMVPGNACDGFLVKKLGKMVMKKLFECVYDECIALALPPNGTQWEKYNDLVAQTERFQDFLTRLGFLSSDDQSLIDYLNNVNSLFANNKSQEILKKAHELMLQDLYHSVQISGEHPIGIPRSEEFLKIEEFVKNCKTETDTKYKPPKCQISLSICNLMLLAYETLKDAQNGSQEGSFHLCNSLYNMFELYCDIAPSYHKDKIVSHPLPAALFHNNCSFVAHHLLTIDKALFMKLTAPGTSLPPPGREPKIAELVPKVRRLGNEGFSKLIQNKKGEICQSLTEAEGFSCVADDDGARAMRAVQNMLHYLKHIGAVWSDVLPNTVYYRSIGTLLSVALEEMIEDVTTIEEFSADDCDCLQRIFSYLIQSAVDVFRAEDDSRSENPEVTLHEFVSNWMKFRELTLMLGFCLQEVSDRWADGKGPLALHFTGGQVASMVTAMFEKTSRRDALVSLLHRKPSVHMTNVVT